MLLKPVAGVYGLGTGLRNFLFDKGILKSKRFDIPVICVGNLSAGGTGKSPHVIMAARELMSSHRVAVLSRGYGRKSKGFHLVVAKDTVDQSGDEPVQYLHYLPELIVAVCESRVEGINRLMQLNHAPDVILLDDAFQHRYVSAGLNILLTDYSRLFYDDYLLPAGNLRESKSGVQRADIIIVSKAPENIPPADEEVIRKRIATYTSAPVYFSVLRYREAISFKGNDIITLFKKDVLLFTGIANPSPLKSFLNKLQCNIEEITFPDHHRYTAGDISNLRKKFDMFARKNPGAVLLTTRKDAMRLTSPDIIPLLSGLPLYVQDMTAEIKEPYRNQFFKLLSDYAQSYPRIR